MEFDWKQKQQLWLALGKNGNRKTLKVLKVEARQSSDYDHVKG